MRILITFILLNFLYITPVSALSFLHGEVNSGLSLGSVEFDEQMSSENRLDHNVNTIGLDVGLKLGLDLMLFQLGVVGHVSWNHWEGKRADGSGFWWWESKGYDNTMRILTGGLYLGFNFLDTLNVSIEYGPDVHAKATYADTESMNPFEHNDKLKGEYVGIGGGLRGGNMGYQVSFRHYTFNRNIRKSGEVIHFNEDRFTKMTYQKVIFQAYLWLF